MQKRYADSAIFHLLDFVHIIMPVKNVNVK